jgi:beta-lactamase superfamily II metal-dependent hydrolase
MSVFQLAMYPASEGDALVLSWGEDNASHHALIDLGRTGDYRNLKPLLQQTGRFELFAITHIDADHIEGVVPLFKETELPFTAEHVWFNAHAQLATANGRLPHESRMPMGPEQGEKMTAGIIRSKWPWNDQFASSVVSVDSSEGRSPIGFPGGLTLTLLSPSDKTLAKLLPVWDQELQKAGLRTTDPDEVARALAGGRVHLGGINVDRLASLPFKEDTAEPNGTSIAFVAEFAGKRILMGADAYPGVIEESLRALGASEACPYRIDCLKVSHHGSKANTSPALLDLIDCTCFAFSTDGSRHGHPNPEMIARLLKKDSKRRKKLIFNFRQDSTIIWDNTALKQQWNYECVFPQGDGGGVVFDI